MPDQPVILKRILRRLRGPRPRQGLPDGSASDPPGDALVVMIDKVRAAPLDAKLCYELGLELLRKGIDADGVQYLERAFRLDPLNIVRFVQTPELKPIRMRDGVISLLTRVRRDEEQRSYAAYA